ncbi:hypothetical protein AALP_AA5G232100 [Arabis alpina]|uniref:MATH domain-containing protein n=1 Tax=Arabis alpina TaxID=50452 RepID=A0A087GYX4_ARAAL|nr:hypothetical protein AALP_AA5G232100 [Arabis alpina]
MPYFLFRRLLFLGTRGFNSKANLTAKESKKIIWAIKDFSSLQSKSICSDEFVVGGCKWHLKAYPKGLSAKSHLALFLEVSNYETLPYGWKIHARHLLTVLNQNSNKNVTHKVLQHWYDKKSPDWGTSYMLPLDQLEAKDSGFIVNGELKIVTDIDVFKVIGKLDVKDETSTSIVTEFMNVNGFELLPSQAKFMSRVLTRHPKIASEFRPMNPTLRTSYMSFLLGIIETMCHSPQNLSKDDTASAYAAVKCLTEAGFKLDWLEDKLDEVYEIKEKKEFGGETHLKGMEDKLKMNNLDVDAITINWSSPSGRGQTQLTALIEALVKKELRWFRIEIILSYFMMLFSKLFL